MDRREFIRRAVTAVAVAVAGGAAAKAAAPTTLSIIVKQAGTVASATQSAQKCAFDCRYKTLFTRVGSLQGNLLYLVNGKFCPCSANRFAVKRGDTITWRRV